MMFILGIVVGIFPFAALAAYIATDATHQHRGESDE